MSEFSVEPGATLITKKKFREEKKEETPATSKASMMRSTESWKLAKKFRVAPVGA